MREALLRLASVGLAAAITLLVFVGALEWYDWHDRQKGSNWHDLGTGFDPELGWAPLPGQRLSTWGGVTTNSRGFRSPEPVADLSSVVLLGDSVVWGYGVPDDATCAYFLHARLRPLGYQVHNLGVSGYGLDQYYLFLRRHLWAIPHPKHVILVILGSGDLDDTGSNARYGVRKPLFRIRDGRLCPSDRPIRKYCLRNLLSKSAFARRLGMAGFRLGLTQLGPGPSLLAGIAGDQRLEEAELDDVSAGLIAGIQQMAQGYGAEMTLVLSPEAAELDPQHESAGLRWFRALAGHNRYRVVDHARVLQAGGWRPEQLYVDPWHYSRLGNELLAASVLKALGSELEVRVESAGDKRP